MLGRHSCHGHGRAGQLLLHTRLARTQGLLERMQQLFTRLTHERGARCLLARQLVHRQERFQHKVACRVRARKLEGLGLQTVVAQVARQVHVRIRRRLDERPCETQWDLDRRSVPRPHHHRLGVARLVAQDLQLK